VLWNIKELCRSVSQNLEQKGIHNICARFFLCRGQERTSFVVSMQLIDFILKKLVSFHKFVLTNFNFILSLGK
jgi:hypothetical protein